VLAGVALEALLLGAAAGAVLVELVGGGSMSAGVSIFLVLFFLGLAAALVAAGRTLWAGRRGGRAPIAVWQVMQGLVGVALLTAGASWAVLGGVALIAVAGVVLVLLLTRGVVEATAG
jgi:hypothetical protein